MDPIHEIPPPLLSEHGIEFFLETKPIGITARMHIHPAVEFLYIKQGLFNIEAEHRSVHAYPGDLILFHSNAIHMIENISEGIGLYYVLKISPSFLFQMFHKTGIPFVVPFFKSRNENDICIPHDQQTNDIQRILQLMIRELESDSSSLYPMQRLLACEFLLTYSRTYMQQNKSSTDSPEVNERAARLISDSIHYINDHYALPLSADSCADMVHLSYSYYAKLFRSVVGKSFKEYLTDLRMAIAYNMLLSSSIKESEIAGACGYENLSNFIVAFKKAYSCTPGELRRNLKSSEQDNN